MNQRSLLFSNFRVTRQTPRRKSLFRDDSDRSRLIKTKKHNRLQIREIFDVSIREGTLAWQF